MNVEVRNRELGRKSGLRVNTRLLKTLAGQTLELAGASASYNLSIVLVNDALMAKLNAQYHDAEGPTDILTFDYGSGQGELIISVDHVIANARRFRTTAARELARYVAHGILHLHGYDDRTPRQRTRMRAAEHRLMNRVAQSVHLTDLVRQ